MQKVLLSVTLSAMGVFWAEAGCLNLPHALVVAPLYPAYGLLYVLLIDTLLRRGERRFPAWYLCGVLVGLITETYVAKVTIWGLQPDAVRVLGVAPGAIGFVVLFYHAFVSFLVPMYMAKRLLGMPLPIRTSRWRDAACLMVPVLLSPIHTTAVGDRWSLGFAVGGLMISALVLSVWVVLLRLAGGRIDDVLLTGRERAVLVCIAVVFFLLATFACTNRSAHGHDPTDFPLGPMLGLTLVTAGLLLLLRRFLRSSEPPRGPVGWSSDAVKLRWFFAWLLWHVGSIAALLALGVVRPIAGPALALLGIAGLAAGMTALSITLFRCARGS